jgi:hypothetical protein
VPYELQCYIVNNSDYQDTDSFTWTVTLSPTGSGRTYDLPGIPDWSQTYNVRLDITRDRWSPSWNQVSGPAWSDS